MGKKLRIALIGFGRSGRDIHTKTLSYLPDLFEIVAGVEIDAQRRDMMHAELPAGCDVYESFEQLYGRTDIDFVINASFSHMHAPISKALLEHGFNVLCEKPLAHTAAEVEALIAAEKASGKRLAIFQQSRFSLPYRKVLDVIASGVIGDVVQYSSANNGFSRRWDWQTVQAFNAGSLYNTGPHPVDQALHFLNYDGMPQVTCFMNRANTWGDAEDHVKLIMTAPGKPVIDVEISSCSAYPCDSIRVQGTRGGIRVSGSEVQWRYFKPEEAPAQKLLLQPLRDDKGQPLYCKEELIWHEDSWTIPAEHADSFKSNGVSFYNMLYTALTTGGPLEITPAQVLQQIAVMEESHKQCPLDRFVNQ